MKLPHILLCLLLTMSIAALALNGCRRIRPPQPPVKENKSTTTRATTTSAPVLPKFIWYKIGHGDTAGRVAQRELRGGDWKDIQYANPEITNWNNLTVGTKIRLPIRKLKDEHKRAAATQPGYPDVAPNPPPGPPDSNDDDAFLTSAPTTPRATPAPTTRRATPTPAPHRPRH